MNLVQNIKTLCQYKEISVARLEKMMNISVSSISKWENSNPSLTKVMDIANFFNVSIEFLCNSDISETQNTTELFMESLIQKTIHKNVKWIEIKNGDTDYAALQNDQHLLSDYNKDDENSTCLDNNIIIYSTSYNNGDIFFVLQEVSTDFEPGSFYKRYYYSIIKHNKLWDFLKVSIKQSESLYNKICDVLYEQPKKEAFKTYMLDFIRSK